MAQTAMPRTKGNFTCNDCGTEGDLAWLSQHACQHNQYVTENGGRCEDYPCCGHTDGDGCYARKEHTSDHWLEVFSDPDYDPYYDDYEG